MTETRRLVVQAFERLTGELLPEWMQGPNYVPADNSKIVVESKGSVTSYPLAYGSNWTNDGLYEKVAASKGEVFALPALSEGVPPSLGGVDIRAVGPSRTWHYDEPLRMWTERCRDPYAWIDPFEGME